MVDLLYHLINLLFFDIPLQIVASNNRNEKVIFKNCAPFTNSISEINNTQVDDAHDIDAVIPMFNYYNRVIFIRKH